MRFLVAGLVLIVLGLTLTEYTRRRAAPDVETKADDGDAPAKKKPKLPAKAASLLEVGPPDATPNAPADAAAALLATLKAGGPAVDGFTPLLAGDFKARQLRATGFGAAILSVDVGDGSALFRLEPDAPPKLLLARARRITALTLDASALFFAEGGAVYASSSRGDAPQPRVSFTRAVVTSLAASGDDLVATVVPANAVDSSDAVGAVVRIDAAGELSLLAMEQVKPRGVLTDGKEAFWLADGLWRAALDGAFSSRLAEGAQAPLALDGDTLVVGAKGEVRRLSRAGGKQQALAAVEASALVSSSGLVRFASAETPAKLYQVTAGAEPTALTTLPGPVSAMALDGTTLFLLTTDATGVVLLAK